MILLAYCSKKGKNKITIFFVYSLLSLAFISIMDQRKQQIWSKYSYQMCQLWLSCLVDGWYLVYTSKAFYIQMNNNRDIAQRQLPLQRFNLEEWKIFQWINQNKLVRTATFVTFRRICYILALKINFISVSGLKPN